MDFHAIGGVIDYIDNRRILVKIFELNDGHFFIQACMKDTAEQDIRTLIKQIFFIVGLEGYFF